MDKPPQVRLQRTSHYFLEGLQEAGIGQLFCNLGTDHAPLIEEMARWSRLGRRHVATVLCPHENVAAHMALGYALVTGRGQGVLLHVDAGTANAALALHNLCRARMPALVMAGRAPFTVRGELPGSRDAHVHFLQEPFDQAGLVRPYIKWEYNLHSGVIAKEVLRRAHSVAHSDPMGPVYLTLPREVLAESWDEGAVAAFPEERFGPVRARGTDPQTVGEIAARLIEARHPILVTRYGGRNPAFAPLLDELARFAGIRVFESSPIFLNIAHDSPCFLGLSAAPDLPKADLGLLIDVDAPWIPRDVREDPATYWVHVDVDAIKERMPMWGFPTQLRVQGCSSVILRQLLEALEARATPAFAERVAGRRAAIAAEREVRRAGLARLAAERGTPGRVSAHHVCAELSQALEPGDLVFDEAVRNTPTVLNQVMRTVPGTRFSLPGGALGYSGGAALGAKLARREATVVQVLGDGSFYQCTPETVYAVSRQYDLPIMTLVLDNAGWSAVKEATLRMHPQGEAKALEDYHALLAPQMDFSKMAESAGGYGVQVSDPAELPGAIRRCLAETRAGRSALLHARIAPL